MWSVYTGPNCIFVFTGPRFWAGSCPEFWLGLGNYRGPLEKATILIENGANVNFINFNADGQSPLHILLQPKIIPKSDWKMCPIWYFSFFKEFQQIRQTFCDILIQKCVHLFMSFLIKRRNVLRSVPSIWWSCLLVSSKARYIISSLVVRGVAAVWKVEGHR